jgi:hypothetical protein
MDINKKFEFLVKDYNLRYSFQRFENYPFGNWSADMHSYYNDSGCLSICNLVQRGELDFYYAKKFSANIAELTEQSLVIDSVEQEIWRKAKKKFLFEYRYSLFLKTLAEVIETQINKTGQFYGIKVK